MRIVVTVAGSGTGRWGFGCGGGRDGVVAVRLDDALRVIALGIDARLRPVEIVYVINDDGTDVVIHAMVATPALLAQAQRARKETR